MSSHALRHVPAGAGLCTSDATNNFISRRRNRQNRPGAVHITQHWGWRRGRDFVILCYNRDRVLESWVAR